MKSLRLALRQPTSLYKGGKSLRLALTAIRIHLQERGKAHRERNSTVIFYHTCFFELQAEVF